MVTAVRIQTHPNEVANFSTEPQSAKGEVRDHHVASISISHF